MPVNTEICDEQWRRFEYCRDRGHLEFVQKADKCDNFLIGNQWDVNDLARLREDLARFMENGGGTHMSA